MKKTLIVIVCSIVFIGCIPINAIGAEKNTPYSNNSLRYYSNLSISENGLLTVKTSYVGMDGETTGATVETKLEKRFLLVFWSEVTSWTDEVSGYYYTNEHSTTVKKGTYRATVEYIIRGTGGEPDVFVDELEYTYK